MTAVSSSSVFPGIVIAGAGPAGLSLACLLQRYHQSFVIIDQKAPGEGLYSKATGLHRNTLRLFSKIGLVDEIARQAIELNGNKIYVNGTLIKTIMFEQGDQTNDKNLSIDQASVEKILLSRLDDSRSRILFEKKVIDFDQDAEGVTISVEDCLTSKIEQIRAKYLVGADGAHSTIRKKMGISFDGITTEEESFTFDAIPSTLLEPNVMAMFTTDSERLVVVPLPEGRYKFSGKVVEARLDQPSTDIRSAEASSAMMDSATLATVVYRRSQMRIDPSSIHGLSFYHTASRVASSFRRQQVFLIGDAAHIFFPAGGYGLNVAIEDAFVLGWKLALTEAGLCHSAVLDSFEKERMDNAHFTAMDATQKKASLADPQLSLEDEKEKQVYAQGSHVFKQVILERMDKIFPLSISQNIRQKERSLFDWIHSGPGIFWLISTSSVDAFTHIRKACAALNLRSPVPFSLAHICSGDCSFPEDKTSCFTITNQQSVEYFKKYPESVISIHSDNFISITAIEDKLKEIALFTLSSKEDLSPAS